MVQRMEQAEPVQHGMPVYTSVAQPQPAVNYPLFRPTISLRTAVIILAIVGFVMFMSVLLKLSERGAVSNTLNQVVQNIVTTRYENEKLSGDILEARDYKRIKLRAVDMGYVMPGAGQIIYVEVPDIQ